MKIAQSLRNVILLTVLATAALSTIGARAAPTSGTLRYLNGPIAYQPKIVMVYVGNWDNSTKSLNAQAVIERFFTSIGGTKYFGTLTGYRDKNGNYVKNLPIQIVNRLFDPDTTNPMNASRINNWLANYVANADQNTVFIQIPYAGIAVNCPDALGCRGNFWTPARPFFVPTGIATAFDSAGNFRPDFSSLWFHELVEAMLDSDGNGYSVIDNLGKVWDISDVCDYNASPWYIGPPVRIRTTWQNDGFTMNGFAPAQLNTANGMQHCSRAYSERAELFGVGTSPYHMYHQHLTATATLSGSAWSGIGTLNAAGFLSGGPGVASWGPDRMDIFNFDSTSHLRHGYFDATLFCSNLNAAPCLDDWGFPPAGWRFHAEPAVTSQGMGRLDLFAIGTQGSSTALFQRTWDSGSDTGWVNRGNPGIGLNGSPAAASFGPGRVDVFVIAADNSIYNGAWNGSTFKWQKWLRAQVDSSGSPIVWQWKPAAESWKPGSFHIMLVDTKGRLRDCGGDSYVGWGACGGWGLPPGGIIFTGSPSIVNLGDERLLISARGSDGQAWTLLWNKGFGPWVRSGGALAGASPALGSF